MLDTSQQALLESFSELLRSGKMDSTHKNLNSLTPMEIANLLESLPGSQRNILWGFVSPEMSGEVLLEITDEVRGKLINLTDSEKLIIALEGLETDELADLFSDLPHTVTKTLLDGMVTQERERLEKVMSYADNTAGGLMDTDAITIRQNINLDIVQRYLHIQRSLPEHTDSLMVVDEKNHYIGTLSLMDIVTKNPGILVKDLTNTKIKGINAEMPAHEITHLFESLDLTSAAVVDADGVLLGRITIDDIVDVIRKEAQEIEFHAAGLSPDETLFSPIGVSAGRRAIWLGFNLVTAFLAAWSISLFQDTLQQMIALAVLIPIVTSMGGIAGSQTLVLTIRGIATGQVGPSNTPLLLAKELSIGFLNSLLWALFVGLLTYFWFHDINIGLVIAVAMIINLLCAAIVGVYIPILLQKIGLDPALGGNVILTTITDITGIIALLGISTIFLL